MMMEPRGSSGTVSWWGAWGTCETKRLEDSDFVFVSFWGGVIVVDYRHARVDEEQGEGGQAGRENVA